MNNNLWHTEHKLGDRRPLKIFARNLGCRADSSEHGSRFSESLPRNAEQFQPGSTIHLWRTTLQPNIYRGRAFDSRRHLCDDFILFFPFFFFYNSLLTSFNYWCHSTRISGWTNNWKSTIDIYFQLILNILISILYHFYAVFRYAKYHFTVELDLIFYLTSL